MKLFKFLLQLFLILCNPVLSFGSIGQDNDTQTGFGFEQELYYKMRARTIRGKLSRSGNSNVGSMYAGGDVSIDGSAIIHRKEITKGDEVRHTLQEHAKGTPTYGDVETRRGNPLTYLSLKTRVNTIKSPGIPIMGETERQRIAHSITNIPKSVENEILDYLAEEEDFELYRTLLWGASASALKPTAEGGLAVNLGIDGAAGTPLMAKHYYDMNEGFATYSPVAATWNSTVNGYLNSITTGDEITLLKLKVLRSKLDKMPFRSPRLNGKKYKAVCLVDGDLWYRIDHLLKTDYKDARARGKDNPVFDVDQTLVWNNMLIAVAPNLEKFRPAYNATNGYPDIGPGIDLDPREYSTTSSIAPMLILGAGAVKEGYNGAVKLYSAKAKWGEHEGLEIAGRYKSASVRSEFVAKDGRAASADNVYCDSLITAFFYEPGVDSLT